MSLAGMQQSLRGKVAIVTGASSGLGWATSMALAREGVAVVAVARRAERLHRLVEAIEAEGGRCSSVSGDAADPQTADRALTQALAAFGRIDIVINNAGQGSYKQLVDTSVDDYDALMRSNMRSSFVFARAAAPHLIAQRSGVLVFICSVAGLTGTANEAVYSASKFAQVGFAQALDAELHPYGIKVCALSPGGIKTEFAVGHGRNAEDVANSRMMDPAELADAVLFVCMQPPNLRVPHLVVRHMGTPR